MKLKGSIKRKLSIAIVVVMMVSFMFAKTVSAKTFLQAAGGKLMKPVLNFAMFIGDAIENAMHTNLYSVDDEDAIINRSLMSIEDIKTGAKFALRLGTGGGIVASKADNDTDWNLTFVGTVINKLGDKLIDEIVQEWYDNVVNHGIDAAMKDLEERLEKENIVDVIELDTLNVNLDLNPIDDSMDVPTGVIYSPYEIFSDDVPLLDINFFNPHKYEKDESSASILQSVVQKWYITLRNIAVVALLSILLYLGIRIVISSSSAEKATYKQTLLDWLIALILVFSMHYIMSFMVTMTESITEILSNGANSIFKIPVVATSSLTGRETTSFTVITNLTGYVRMMAGFYNSSESTLKAVEFVIIYLVIIAYTVMFTIIYFKRVIYMAFLTIIAPLTAITYPVRKKNSTGGNAFGMWLREYAVNLLLQPIHLLLYSVIIGSTMQLAAEHPIYAIVALACLIPAQKLFFEIFGIRTPQYADTERTMRSERRAGRFVSRTAGNVLREAAKGIRMVGGLIGGAPGGGIPGVGKGKSISQLEASDGSSEDIENGDGIQKTRLSSDIDRSKIKTNTGIRNTDNTTGKYETNLGNSDANENSSNNLKQNTINEPSTNDKNVTLDANENSSNNSKQNTINEPSTNDKNVTLGVNENSSNNSKQNIINEPDSSDKNATLSSDNIQNVINKNIISKNLKQVQVNSKNADIKNEFSDFDQSKVELGNTNAQMNFEQVMQEIYPEYKKNGIHNIKEFKAAYSLEQGGASRQEVIATYKIAQEMGDIRKNPGAEEQWKAKLTDKISKANEIQQLIENRKNEINEKYRALEEKAEEKYKVKKRKNSNQEYKEFAKKKNEMLEKIKNDKNKEMEQVKQIPVHYARRIITQVEKYYDKLDKNEEV